VLDLSTIELPLRSGLLVRRLGVITNWVAGQFDRRIFEIGMLIGQHGRLGPLPPLNVSHVSYDVGGTIARSRLGLGGSALCQGYAASPPCPRKR
jgi:hypothetical protein